MVPDVRAPAGVTEEQTVCQEPFCLRTDGITCADNECDAKAGVLEADALRQPVETEFPQPQRQDGKEPCGECRIQPGETCDICGALRQPVETEAVDGRAICEALGFDPTNHHNAAVCPYCNPDGLVFAPVGPAPAELGIALAAHLYNADEPMADGEVQMTAAENVLGWLLIEKIGVPDDRNYTPNEAQDILLRRLQYATEMEGELAALRAALTKAAKPEGE